MGAEQPPQVWDTGRGLTVRYRGRLLYSSVDPRRGVRRSLEELAPAVPPRTLVFVPSLGLGHGLAELAERTPDTSHVLCIESDQVLFAAACGLEPRGFPDHPRLTVVRAGAPEAAAAVLGSLGVHRFRRVMVVPLCAGYELDRSLYDRMAEALRDAIRVHWQNRMTLIHSGQLWVRNLVANLAVLPRVRDWSELHTERPVVVAGAGPSLESALEWIRRRRSAVYLLAVDTALPILADAGLAADAVLDLEARWANLRDFLGASLASFALIADIVATPALLRRAPRLYLCSSSFASIRLLDRLEAAGLRPGAIPALGSVGVAAIYVALRMTSGPVFTAGLDFAYTGGRIHARGAPGHRSGLAESRRLEPLETVLAAPLLARRLLHLEGKRGERVPTDLVLQGYAREAARIAAPSGRVYDLDPRGLEKGGLEPIELPDPGVAPRAEVATLGECASRPRALGEAARTRASVRALIEAERSLLARASRRLGSLLGQPTVGLLDAEARSELEAVDYLYCHFPDPQPLPCAEPSFLARVARLVPQAEARWLQAESMLGPGP